VTLVVDAPVVNVVDSCCQAELEVQVCGSVVPVPVAPR
jgi:hypothetical protein